MLAGFRTVLAVLVVGLSSHLVHGQNQQKFSEPFEAIDQNQLPDKASPTVRHRLDNIERLPTSKAVYVFRLNPSVEIGEGIKISIPNQITFRLSRSGGENRDSKDFTWFGELQGDLQGTATLVARNGEITGSISTPRGVYRITPLGDQTYAVIEINRNGFPKEEPPSARPQ
jgi:hypothetical protein